MLSSGDLTKILTAECSTWIEKLYCQYDEVTLVLKAEHLLQLCKGLKENQGLAFDTLVDVSGVDYLHYGLADWQTEEATGTGFSRGVDQSLKEVCWTKSDEHPERFAVVYHLLSVQNNARLRLKVFVPLSAPKVHSLVGLWPGANWFEREVFDLYGILFEGHPDLRRLLTDYGFKGHPFRKDFPLSGEVEVRYDHAEKRVIYMPVDIQPRVLVPKVIRDDNRYKSTDAGPIKEQNNG